MEVKAKKVLIADDEPDIVEIISYNLVKEGYEISSAKKGIASNTTLRVGQTFKPGIYFVQVMQGTKSGNTKTG